MALYQDKSRKDWRYEFQVRGRRYTGRGHKTKADARTAREAHRKRTLEAPMIQVGMVFKDAANLYLDYCKLRFAQKTYKYKAFVYKQFLQTIGNMGIDAITPHIVHEYLKTRPSNHNYNVHRKELSALFNFTIDKLEVLSFNPARKLDKMPHTPKEKQPPTEQEILKLLMAADPVNELPLIEVLLHTLARIDEVLRSTWQDVNFDNRTLVLWTRKRKDGAFEPDTMPINQDLYDVLWNLWKRREQNKWVFYNKKTGTRYHKRPKLMRAVCGRAGIPYFGFHVLRHFMASFLADRKKQSTKTVQKLLRHKNLRTTELYLHSIDEQARRALASLEGVFSTKTTTKTHNQDESEEEIN